ncbi:pectate lyase family protein [Steroidobacter cummioxidans]|uniref:pectate lyase family protein n=1 Tax=Steroidobacter cummioxidans TaxID=1803913 RepID=UPI00128FD6BE|nr:pectate lyase [Steroidobacter cummioxidans]
MKPKIPRLAAAVALACGMAPLANAVPVIPGAIGHGISTPAGRGGTVIRVTNTNYSGAGSLKACVDASGPRVCVFEVSGTITLPDDLTIRNRYITIAGQTAPSPGITLRGSGLLIRASDVLVQHIRVRPGDATGGEPPDNRDALKIEAPREAPISNVIVDHCTFTWSLDEVASAWQYWDNISLLNNIFAEPLHDSIHPDGKHGFGVLIGPVDGSATLAGNLFANMESRNPMTAASRTVIVNNLIYNWANTAVDLQSRGLVTQNSVVGNVFVRGPDTWSRTAPIGLRGDASTLRSGAKVFLSDNVLHGASSTSDAWASSLAGSIYGSLNLTNFKSTSPLAWPASMTTLPTSENVVRDHVLKFAGARPADRDAVDTRIINQTRNGTGRMINCVAPNGTTRCQLNGGGYPALAENRRALTLPANPNEVTASGYTNLELWLHRMAAQVEGRSSSSPEAPTLDR